MTSGEAAVPSHGRRLARIGLAVSVSGALLYWSLRRVDVSSLANLDLRWASFGVFLTVPMTLLSALRWADAARRVEVPLSFRAAAEAYYLSSLLNQLLPGGVAGDVLRAYQHGRLSKRYGPTAASVIAERAAGQLALVFFGLPALTYVGLLESSTALTLGGLVVGVIVLAIWWQGRSRADGSIALALRAFLRPRAVLIQLGLSTAILAMYLAIFGVAAAALAVRLDEDLWFGAFPAALFAMSVPIGFAGWGLREGAALLAFEALGRPADDGVALGLTYGAIVFVGALPGAIAPVIRAGSRSGGAEHDR